MAQITLLNLEKTIELMLDSGNLKVNDPMMNSNTFDMKLYKGAPNQVDFIVRDRDRKLVQLRDKTLTINIISTENDELVLQQDLDIVDPYKGHARLNLLESTLDNMNPGYYRYSVSWTDEENNGTFFATNFSFDVTGIFELIEGATGVPRSAIEFSSFSYNSGSGYYESSIREGSLQVNNAGDIHTYAIYVTDYTGEVVVEGTLDNNPDALGNDWFVIESFDFVSQSGIISGNFQLNLMWFRVRYKDDSGNIGTVDKVLLRI